MAKTIPERSTQNEKDLWAIHDIYASDEAWENDLKTLKGLIAKVPDFAGKLSESAQTLYDYMQLDEKIILQVAENLVSNALGYAKAEIHVTLEKRGAALRMVCKNCGAEGSGKFCAECGAPLGE